jgi:hypothetical protein
MLAWLKLDCTKTCVLLGQRCRHLERTAPLLHVSGRLQTEALHWALSVAMYVQTTSWT